MDYTAKIIRKSGQKTASWSGGTTTELAIYPEDALYSSRNFIWRLSSAVVELEESVFTALPGIWRIIMVIEGEMQLEHEGHHSIYLKPYEQDSFYGGWITKSRGKVRDFNLMLSEGWNGNLEAFCIDGEEYIKLGNRTAGTYAFYCTEGSIDVKRDEEERFNLGKGDMLLINSGSQTDDVNLLFCNRADEQTSHVIKIDIYTDKTR